MDDNDFRTRDDVDETFAEAVVHKRSHKVLGYRLRPFSFWHVANLDFVESPFAGHKKAVSFPALFLACRICQLAYPQTFSRGQLGYIAELWKARRFPYFANRGLRSPFVIECTRFSAYIRDYASRPEYMETEDSSPAKCPWYLFEVAFFKQHNPGLTWAQCWDMPIGEASWFNAATAEVSGARIELVTPEYRKAFRSLGYKD